MGVLSFHDNFRRRIGSLLEGGFTDAVLLVEEVEIPVHKCILAVQSEYFSRLFSSKNGSRETCGSQAITEVEEILNANHQAIVEISDMTPPLSDNVFVLKNTKVEVVRAVLEYFYRGEYNYHDNVETHWLALELAHQFKLRDLEATLIDNLVKSITTENFVHFYNMKMRYKNEQMKKSCSRLLKKNGEKIAKSDNFSKLNRVSLLSLLDEESFAAAEIDIFRAAERWAGVNKPNKETVEEIVQKIRLATISQEDLFDVVRSSKELPSIDILEPIQSITKKDAASTNFRQQPPTVTDLNMAKSSLGPKPVNTNFTRPGFSFGPIERTSHEVGGKPYNFGAKPNKSDSSPVKGIPIASTNVVLESRGATVTGGESIFGHPYSMKCIDGDEDSFVFVSEDSPLLIKLGQPHWLSSVRVKIDADGNRYIIESSPDGESWQPVGGGTEGERGEVWRTFEFSSRVVMYFRVTVKRINFLSSNICVFHFESPASTIAVTN